MRTEIIKMENSSSCEIDLIEVRDGQAVTSSLVVAKYFGKAHKDVLRAIKSLECSELFNRGGLLPRGCVLLNSLPPQRAEKAQNRQ